MAKIWKSFSIFMVLVMVIGVAFAIFPASPVSADLSGITVIPYTSNFISANSGYQISMTSGAVLDNQQSITIRFPAGTTMPAGAGLGMANYTVAGIPCTLDATVSSRDLTVYVPGAITPGVPFSVTITPAAGIFNPSISSNSAAGLYKVEVWTSVESSHVLSSPYTITGVDVWLSDGTTWEGSYTTIQAAINAAAAGDIITVPAGTYSEALTVNKALTIRSISGAATTFIAPTSADMAGFNVTAAGVTIGGSGAGFTITAGGQGGLCTDTTGGNGIRVEGNTFKSYADGESRGMWFVKLWNSAVITGNTFATGSICGTGMQVINADGATISNNTVPAGTLKYSFLTFKAEAHHAPPDMNEYNAATPSVIDNVSVTGNTVGTLTWDTRRSAVLFAASTKHADQGEPQAQDLSVGTGGVSITGNTFATGSGNGVKIDADKTAPDSSQVAHITGVANILINSNNFTGNTTAGVNNGNPTAVNALNNWWGNASGPAQASNKFNVGTQGDPVTGNVSYVRWLNAAYPGGTAFAPVTKNSAAYYSSIQAAITDATSGDNITCAAGTYSENLTVDKALTIRSVSGAASTFIAPTSANIAGFNVTAAGATIGGSGAGFTISAGGQGGIYANVTGGSGITVQGNTFKSYADGESRGMWFDKLWNSALITGNSFTTPRVGTGMEVVNADNATISNNTADNNTLKYSLLTFKAEAFIPSRNTGTPYAEYVAMTPSVINNLSVTGNIVGTLGYTTPAVYFAASTKHVDHGEPQAENLSVSAGGVSITGNTFHTGVIGVKIDADKPAPDNGAEISHITGVANILINNNNFTGNATDGVSNGNATAVNSKYNYWGNAYGPSLTDPTLGTITYGDQISDNVTFQPWLVATYSTPPTGGDISVTNTSPLPDASTGVFYSDNLTSSGGAGTKTWAYYGPGGCPDCHYPPGLSVNAAGVLSGTPTTTKDSPGYKFGIQVQDPLQGAYKAVELSVYVGLPVITTTSLPSWGVGTYYSANLTATGGNGSYAWSIYTGSLPAGLSLDASTGAITGTPTTAGTSSFRVRVVSLGVGYKDLSITITQSRIGVWRPSTGNWYVYPSFSPTQFGLPSDIPVQRDYNGDNNTEFAVYRPHGGNWFVYPSLTPTQFGLSCDVPVPADYNHDGKAEFAIWRPNGGNWFVYPSLTPTQFGLNGDVPVPADYNGDGRADFAVWRPSAGNWYVYPNFSPTQFGLPGDIPVPADYNGDGKAEFAVYRPHGGLWFVYPNFTPTQFGLSGDIPVPGDYTGVGHAQFAVWRPSNGMWYVYPDLAHPLQFGLTGDVPGNILTSVYYLKYFVSSCNPLTVISTVPANGGPCVAVPSTITATFSKAMNPSTIDNVTFSLKHGVTSDNGTVIYSGVTATFTPVPALEPNRTYTATISTAAQDPAGNHLANPYVWSFITCGPTAPNPTAPNLGEGGRFVILAYAAITSDPASQVSNGDMGITPLARTYITGFTPVGSEGAFAELTNGLSYAPEDPNPSPFPYPLKYATPTIGDPWASTGAMLTQAKSDLDAAYTYLANQTLPAPAACPAELGGHTLYRGIYLSAVPVTIHTGDLTLDAQGDPDSVWIFQIESTLTTSASGGSIILAHGAQAKNVYFQVAGAGTAGTVIGSTAGTHFYGNVLSWKQINVTTSGANVTGRLFSSTAQVTLVGDNITKAP